MATGCHVLLHAHHEFSLWTLPDACAAALASAFPAVRFTHARSVEAFERALPECDVLFGWGIDPGNFARARRLRWVQSTAAGVQGLLFPAMVESPVLLTNARGLNAVPIAEHVLAVLLCFARKLHLCRDAQREGRWSQEETWAGAPPLRELAGATLGIVGMGAIGREIARRARVFGMRVLGLRRGEGVVVEADQMLPRGSLHELLARSDVVVLAVPSTRETEGMFGAAEVAALREGAVLVNIGRGDVVDERALLEGLRAGRPAGAALDVFAEEPLPPRSPFWSLPQVLVTPHVAGATPHYWPRLADLFGRNLTLYLEGKPLLNVVDKRAGY